MFKDTYTHNKNLILPIILAGLFWALYTFYIDDFLATDLRLFSSILTEYLLNILGIDCQRNGTVLYGNGMTFEVIGACSGSTTLKIMLGAGIFLSSSWRRLTFLQRIILIFSSGIMAIIANGIRVTILVIISLHKGSPVTAGILHNIIGILTFIFTLCLFCIICYYTSINNKPANKKNPNERNNPKLISLILSAITGLLLVFIFLPFLQDLFTDWLGSSWNTNNRLGFIYFSLPVILLGWEVYKIRKKQLRNSKITKAIKIFFAISLFFPVAATICDIKIIAGIGLLTLIFTLILYLSNMTTAILALPLIALLSLSFPRIPLRITDIMRNYNIFQILSSEEIRLLITIVIILLQLFIFLFLIKKNIKPKKSQTTINVNTKEKSVFFFSVTTITTIILLIFSATDANSPATSNTLNNINFPFLLHNKWLGEDIPLKKADIAYFGKKNIISRNYYKLPLEKKSPAIELLITSSAGDRHKNHPPEFCQSGSGWQIINTEKVTLSPDNLRIATLLTLAKQTQQKFMLYWFCNSQNNEKAIFTQMMLADLLSRLQTTTPEWLIIRVFSKSRIMLLNFSRDIPYPLIHKNIQ